MTQAFETLVRDIQVKVQAIFLKKADQNPGRQAMINATRIPWYDWGWHSVSIY